MIADLTRDELPLVLPLLRQVQHEHVRHVPERFHADGDDAAFLAHLQKGFDESEGFVLAKIEDSTVLGYIFGYVMRRPTDAFQNAVVDFVLDQICVDAQHRRNGIARALVAAFKAKAQQAGADGWRVTHWEFNTASAALMAQAGATPTVIVRRQVF